MREQQFAKDNLILKVVTGSHLYGTNQKGSDLQHSAQVDKVEQLQMELLEQYWNKYV